MNQIIDNMEKSGTIGCEFLTLEKIHGTKAKALFEKGVEIWLQSSALSPFDERQQAERLRPELSFSAQVDAFEYFQCTKQETGYRPSFYIAVDVESL